MLTSCLNRIRSKMKHSYPKRVEFLEVHSLAKNKLQDVFSISLFLGQLGIDTKYFTATGDKVLQVFFSACTMYARNTEQRQNIQPLNTTINYASI